MNDFICGIIQNAVLHAILGAQMVGYINRERFNVERILRYYYGGTVHQLVDGRLGNYLHLRVVGAVDFHWQRSVVSLKKKKNQSLNNLHTRYALLRVTW